MVSGGARMSAAAAGRRAGAAGTVAPWILACSFLLLSSSVFFLGEFSLTIIAYPLSAWFLFFSAPLARDDDASIARTIYSHRLLFIPTASPANLFQYVHCPSAHLYFSTFIVRHTTAISTS